MSPGETACRAATFSCRRKTSPKESRTGPAKPGHALFTGRHPVALNRQALKIQATGPRRRIGPETGATSLVRSATPLVAPRLSPSNGKQAVKIQDRPWPGWKCPNQRSTSRGLDWLGLANPGQTLTRPYYMKLSGRQALPCDRQACSWIFRPCPGFARLCPERTRHNASALDLVNARQAVNAGRHALS